ncbi:phosphotransferase enzyme family-domain-containing protein [Podospora didyma]|uniref:Phosphotransferase enzyme family-domain-containing protein n=1 Tax=Podospora didyma TaxID=330526 RepID=A0AAE0K0P4_9PEZI|nr:phosphotransferase enzyme family-domain-containing protein [Podospora didyma]
MHAGCSTTSTIVTYAGGPPLIMRVSLPIYPRHKMRVEVAILRWVRQNTVIPVPKVVSFDDSNNNDIAFEWILMEFMEGTSAHRRWRTMSMEQKVALTRQLAAFQAELLGLAGKPEHKFTTIGTLDLRDVGDGGNPSKLLEDEDDIEDAEEVLSVARKLLPLVPKVFPSTVPEFLDKPVREEEPQWGNTWTRRPSRPPLQQSITTNELYFIRRMEWEATQLQKVYKARMRELLPQWSPEESHPEIDFFQAVMQCDGMWVKQAGRWPDRMENGEVIRFEDA